MYWKVTDTLQGNGDSRSVQNLATLGQVFDGRGRVLIILFCAIDNVDHYVPVPLKHRFKFS